MGHSSTSRMIECFLMFFIILFLVVSQGLPSGLLVESQLLWAKNAKLSLISPLPFLYVFVDLYRQIFNYQYNLKLYMVWLKISIARKKITISWCTFLLFSRYLKILIQYKYSTNTIQTQILVISVWTGQTHWFHVPSVQSLMNIVSLIGKTMTGILLSLCDNKSCDPCHIFWVLHLSCNERNVFDGWKRILGVTEPAIMNI